MADYPNWRPATITTRSPCTPEWANEVQDNLRALLADFYNSKGNKANITQFWRQSLTTLGYVKIGAISHNDLYNVTEDQHHKRYHGSTHISSDKIPYASTGRRGLAGSGMIQKLDTIQTGANYNRITASSYVGLTTSIYFSVGFRPGFLIIVAEQYGTTGAKRFEFMDAVTRGFCHLARSGIGVFTYHTRPILTNLIRITTFGFRVKASCNVAGRKYHYICFKQT